MLVRALCMRMRMHAGKYMLVLMCIEDHFSHVNKVRFVDKVRCVLQVYVTDMQRMDLCVYMCVNVSMHTCTSVRMLV